MKQIFALFRQNRVEGLLEIASLSPWGRDKVCVLSISLRFHLWDYSEYVKVVVVVMSCQTISFENVGGTVITLIWSNNIRHNT